jgi:O-antigen ligase
MTDSVNYTGRKKQGLAIACLILGILSLIFSEIVIGALFGLIGLILGIVRLFQRPDKKGMLYSGMVLSVVGIIASLLFGYLWTNKIIPAFKQAFQHKRQGNSSLHNSSGSYPLDSLRNKS